MAIKDLIEPSQPTEVRHYALTFIRNLIYGQVHTYIQYISQLAVSVRKCTNIYSVLTHISKS